MRPYSLIYKGIRAQEREHPGTTKGASTLNHLLSKRGAFLMFQVYKGNTKPNSPVETSVIFLHYPRASFGPVEHLVRLFVAVEAVFGR